MRVMEKKEIVLNWLLGKHGGEKSSDYGTRLLHQESMNIVVGEFARKQRFCFFMEFVVGTSALVELSGRRHMWIVDASVKRGPDFVGL